MNRLKYFLLAAVASIVPVLHTAPAYAQLGQESLSKICSEARGGELPAACKSKGQQTNPLIGPTGILTKAAGLLALVVGVAAVFGVVLSGLRMITSLGDANTVAQARKGIIYSLVGLAVALSAQALVTFVLSRA